MTRIAKYFCLALLMAAACDLEVGSLNNPEEIEIVENPTVDLVIGAATGLLYGNRQGFAENNGYILHTAVIGREAYNLSAADPRFRSELLAGTLNPGNRLFGGNFWEFPYANIHNAVRLLNALEIVAEDDFSPEELEGLRGFAKTIQALDYLTVINTHDENGAVLVSSDPVEDQLDPLVSKEETFTYIKTLLNEAEAHLQSAGDEFAFVLSSGYSGFDTPATFISFNRAVKARVDVYTEDWQDALDSLEQSFLVADGEQLQLGVYHTYSESTGDRINELISPDFVVNPGIAREFVTEPYKGLLEDLNDEMAEEFIAGLIRELITTLSEDPESVDPRIAKKIVPLAANDIRTVDNLSSQFGFSIYTTPTTPAPIIRNEELILLRAEAQLRLGNLDEALADINFIRQNSGLLDPVEGLDEAGIEAELIKQRRYSLLLEGHRWIDMRRWGLLNSLLSTPINKPRPGDVVHARYPIPKAECDARPGEC